MITPPDGSDITIEYEDGYQDIVIPHKSTRTGRWMSAIRILMTIGIWVGMIGIVVSDAGNGRLPDAPFVVLLGGLSLLVLSHIWTLYRMFHPVPEVLALGRYEMLYDSGVVPFDVTEGAKSRNEYWVKLFQRRVQVNFGPGEIKTIKLREHQTGNKLTIDCDGERIELAIAATAHEREWLYEELCKYYKLPIETPGSRTPGPAAPPLPLPSSWKRTKHFTGQCPTCKAPTRIELEGAQQWQTCDACGWSGLIEE